MIFPVTSPQSIQDDSYLYGTYIVLVIISNLEMI
jgi:hypothetical protein